MAYIRVQWIHDFQDEPILLYSELDCKRNEIRKVKVYKNDKLGYACEIDREYFESIWSKAVGKNFI